jgi:hypothetical protein
MTSENCWLSVLHTFLETFLYVHMFIFRFLFDTSDGVFQGFFTGGNRAVYRGYRCYRWGTVTVPSGSNRWKNSTLNLNSK